MRAYLVRHAVVTEISRSDSLSDTVSKQVHFGKTHLKLQLTKAAYRQVQQPKYNCCMMSLSASEFCSCVFWLNA